MVVNTHLVTGAHLQSGVAVVHHLDRGTTVNNITHCEKYDIFMMLTYNNTLVILEETTSDPVVWRHSKDHRWALDGESRGPSSVVRSKGLCSAVDRCGLMMNPRRHGGSLCPAVDVF